MIPLATRSGPANTLTDVAGLRVGHAQRTGGGWLTGTTVVLAPGGGMVAGVDIRGGGPATRETDALDPRNLVDRIDAIVLTGGSAYGLAAADGVARWLEEHDRGFPVGAAPGEVVPVVPAAGLFDLGRGGDFAARPDAAMGRLAAAAAAEPAGATATARGGVGAGTGALTGGLRAGIGTAGALVDDGVVVAALVAANAAGSAVDPRTGLPYGLPCALDGEFPLRTPPAEEHRAAQAFLSERAGRPSPMNTVIGVVATNAALGRAEAGRLAAAGHDGLARALRPAHTLFDGDTLFGLATGAVPLPAAGDPRGTAARAAALSRIHAAAADAVTRAIVHALLAAEPHGDLPAYRSLYPRACADL